MDYKEDMDKALKTLKEGGVILYPTDTIWGLGCDATNKEAVEKIFRIKKRRESKSLIILVNSLNMLERYVSDIPEAALQIIEVSDKPVTIIYPGGKGLADGACNEDGSTGIRICNDEFCNELISRFRKPVISTSANISGEPYPADFSQIADDIISLADYVVVHRQDDYSERPPSSIIKFGADGTISIIRK